MALRVPGLLRVYAASYARFPYRASFATCLVKGAIADAAAQLVIERKKQPSWRHCHSAELLGPSVPACSLAECGITGAYDSKAEGLQNDVVNGYA